MVTDTPAEEAAMNLGTTGWATEPGTPSHPGTITPIFGELRWTWRYSSQHRWPQRTWRFWKAEDGQLPCPFLEVEVWLLQLGENGLWVNSDGNCSPVYLEGIKPGKASSFWLPKWPRSYPGWKVTQSTPHFRPSLWPPHIFKTISFHGKNMAWRKNISFLTTSNQLSEEPDTLAVFFSCNKTLPQYQTISSIILFIVHCLITTL